MGGNKAIAAAVLIVVILGAVVIIVKQQGGSATAPDRVLDRKVSFVLAEEPWTVKEFRYGDIQDKPIDEETGYRIIDGKKWGSAMVCASSDLEGDPHMIPVPPRSRTEDEDVDEDTMNVVDDMDRPYECPICGKEANIEAMNGPRR